MELCLDWGFFEFEYDWENWLVGWLYFRLKLALRSFALNFLGSLHFLNFLLATVSIVFWGGGAKFLSFDSDQLLLPFSFHFDVLLMLLVKLGLFLLITELSYVVVHVGNLFVLDLSGGNGLFLLLFFGWMAYN